MKSIWKTILVKTRNGNQLTGFSMIRIFTGKCFHIKICILIPIIPCNIIKFQAKQYPQL